jgi:STE24 endopeptidase
VREFDPERQLLAREYQRRQRRLSILGFLLTIVGLLAALLSGLSASLQSLAEGFSRNPWVVVALYFIIGYTLARIVFLPLAVGAEGLDRRYGMSIQSWPSWGRNIIKGYLLGLGFGLPSAEVLYWALRNFPGLWWAVVWAFGMLAWVVLGFLAPVLIMPLFHRYQRVEEPEVNRRLQALAARARLPVLGVYRMSASQKTSRAIGALTGIGSTRRIVLSDTLLEAYSPEEVEAVVAHEMAHHAHGDVLRGFISGAAYFALALYVVHLGLEWLGPPLGVQEPSGVVGLPLILLLFSLQGFAFAPLFNYLSRHREGRADAYALRLTENADAFASAMVKLHDRNLSEARPGRMTELLFYTHPPGHRRVAMALGSRGPSKTSPQDQG